MFYIPIKFLPGTVHMTHFANTCHGWTPIQNPVCWHSFLIHRSFLREIGFQLVHFTSTLWSRVELLSLSLIQVSGGVKFCFVWNLDGTHLLQMGRNHFSVCSLCLHHYHNWYILTTLLYEFCLYYFNLATLAHGTGLLSPWIFLLEGSAGITHHHVARILCFGSSSFPFLTLHPVSFPSLYSPIIACLLCFLKIPQLILHNTPVEGQLHLLLPSLI